MAVDAVLSEAVSRPKTLPNTRITGNFRDFSGFPGARSSIIAIFFLQLSSKIPAKTNREFCGPNREN